jgi:hypothetical protein
LAAFSHFSTTFSDNSDKVDATYVKHGQDRLRSTPCRAGAGIHQAGAGDHDRALDVR